MDAQTLDGLLKKNAISQSTYDAGMAKFSPAAVSSSVEEPVTPEAGIVPASAPATQAAPTPAVATVASPQAQADSGIKLASDIRPVVPVGPAAQTGGLENSFELGQKAVAQEAQAGAKQAQAEAGYISQAQKELQRQADAVKVAEADRQVALDDQVKKIQSASEEASKLASIDPKRFYKDASTVEKIGFGIAAFLGSFGGGENQALKMIQGAVDRDIEAQKQDYERAKGKVGLQQSIYGDMMKQFGDKRTAEAAARLSVLGNAELQLKKAAATYKSPQIQAKALEGIAHIEQQKQVLVGQVKQAAEVQAAKQRLAGGSAAGNISADIEKLPKEDRVRYVNLPGIQGFAPSEERAKVLSSLGTELNSAKSNIDELSKMDRSLPFSEQRAKASTLQKSLIGQLRVALTGPGAMSEGERELIEDVLANPTQIFQSNAKAKLDTLKGVLDKKMQAAAKAEGITPLQVNAAK